MRRNGKDSVPEGCVWVTIVIGALILFLALFVIFYFVYRNEGGEAIASLGDAFGGVTSFFTGLGFLGLIWTITQQKKANDLNQESLEMQRMELIETRKEMEVQTKQFEKQAEQAERLYHLEKEAHLRALLPDIDVVASSCRIGELEIDDKSTTQAAKLGLKKRSFGISLELKNYGATIRSLNYQTAMLFCSDGEILGYFNITGSYKPLRIASGETIHLSLIDDTKPYMNKSPISYVLFEMDGVDSVGRKLKVQLRLHLSVDSHQQYKISQIEPVYTINNGSN